MKLNKNKNSEAMYLQIVEMAKRVIVKGELSPGAKIMSIDDYSKHLEVSKNTIIMAYAQLVKEGLLDSKKGAGFFVTQDKYRIADERQKLIDRYSLKFAESLKECLPESYTKQGQRIDSKEVTRILDKVRDIILSECRG